MGCPILENAEYQEVLVSNGRPKLHNFARRNRRIVKAWTYDQLMEFTWTEDNVFLNGPAGTEVVVRYTIGTRAT